MGLAKAKCLFSLDSWNLGVHGAETESTQKHSLLMIVSTHPYVVATTFTQKQLMAAAVK